jgi:hypothetical protein
MGWPIQPPPAKGWKLFFRYWFLWLPVALLAPLGFMAWGGITQSGMATRELADLRMCLVGVRIFDKDHHRLPDTLDELYPDYIDNPIVFYSYGWKDKEFRSLLYQKSKSDTVPALMSQHKLSGKYNVMFYNGTPQQIGLDPYNRFLNTGKWTTLPMDFLDREYFQNPKFNQP